MSDDTTAWINRARALDKAATPGSWGVEGSLFGPAHVRIGQVWGSNWRRDLEWIAHARHALPAAVEALVRVRELHTKSTAVRTLPRQLRKDQADGEPHHYCTYCAEVWPCETYEATEVDA